MKAPLILLVLAAVLALGLSLATGDQPIPLAEVWGAMTGADTVPPPARFIITELRLPRALTGALVGAALGTGGAICQAIMRNPLADPGIIGISAGAALAAMLVIVELSTVPERLLPVMTFLGAITMSVLILLLSSRGGTTSLRIILVGIGLSAFAGAGASFISTFGEINLVQRAMVWLSGSLQDSRWDKLPVLALWTLPPIAVVWALARELDLTTLGDDIARGRGQRANLLRWVMVLTCAVICGAAVAASGLIAFVGLAAPHVARALVGRRHLHLIPASALCGAVLVLVADLVARSVMPPVQLPVGVVTALLGAPFFGFLLWRRRHD